METVISADAVERAVSLLADGEPVALPTETVYGLAADATRPEAVLKIFEAKERPFFDPLIVHLPEAGWLDRVTRDRPLLVEKLAEAFWPGPLTLVLPRREIIPDVVTSGLNTVAVRMSAHPLFREVASRFGKPLAAPSANRFGCISPTAAAHVMAELGGRIPLILDGGPTDFGVESTIVAIDGNCIKILRSGPVTSDALAKFGEVIFEKRGDSPIAPGQLQSHYAPRTRTRIVASARDFIPEAGQRRGLLAWNPPPDNDVFATVEILSATQNLREAAANLFAAMRRLDEAALDVIVAERVPEEGLGIAIMDRLRKASANG
ncbi:MAG TPA: L-threonylcarbamoyladenylate synthase [Chthoniobacteraceae bacterium]|nr:L-threonylcarbamoyladenylate synthase [Chthoniobacteraceae bacterium]